MTASKDIDYTKCSRCGSSKKRHRKTGFLTCSTGGNDCGVSRKKTSKAFKRQEEKKKRELQERWAKRQRERDERGW